MDQETTLDSIRAIIKRGYKLDREDVEQLVDLVDALDRCLSRGGFLPQDWQDARSE